MPGTSRIITGAAVLVMLGACTASTQKASSIADSAEPVATGTPPGNEAIPSEVVERGRRALSDAGITGELRLVSAAPRQWPDSSLGCRKPGMQYLQVITSGYALRFADTEGRAHTVHVAGNTAIVCTPAVTGVPKRMEQPRRAQDLQRLIAAARADLAPRLNVPVEEVRLENYEATTWSDMSLDCADLHTSEAGPQEGGEGVPGFRLFLTVRGHSYVYHADANRVIPCPPIESM